MKRLLLSSVLVLCAALPALVRAQEPVPVPPKPIPELPVAPTPVEVPGLPAVTTGIIKGPCNGCERDVAVPKVTLVPEETAIAVPKLTLREVEVGRDMVTKMELSFREERHTITEMVLKPRVCEQQVVVTEMQPETTTDPVTGKTSTCPKPVQVVKTVKVTVYDTVPVEREVIVRIPCLKPVEQEVSIRKLVLDETTVAAIERRYHYLLVPNVLTVFPSCPFCP